MFENLETLEDWLFENEGIYGKNACKKVITICPIHQEKLLVIQAYFAENMEADSKGSGIQMKYPYCISSDYSLEKSELFCTQIFVGFCKQCEILKQEEDFYNN